MEDNECIKELIIGSRAALQILYKRHSDRIFNTIIGFVKNKEDAEEVLQDVFVAVFKDAKKFQFNSAVSTWMYRIAVNKSLDFIRKGKAQKRFGIFTNIYRKGEDEPRAELVEIIHPGIQQEQKEEAILLFRHIDLLSENQKVAFVLTQIEGYPQKEVAEIMNLSRKSIESLVKRAKDNLKESLLKYYPERGKYIK